MLLNGRRTSGFGEVRRLPPEAIERVEVLPEEVALNYGFRPDQRVVNIVLRRRFRSVTLDAQVGAATRGGRTTTDLERGMLRISRDTRWSLDLERTTAERLLESERDLASRSALPDDPADPRPFRTLAPATDALSASGALNRPIGSASGTLSFEIDRSTSEGLQGFPRADLVLPAREPFRP